MSEHNTYVAELIQLDGRGDYASGICRGCHAHAQFQCIDCNYLQLYCHECTVTNHEWIGEFFQGVSLKTFGFRVQHGHPAGQHCILPRLAFNDEFVLIDTNRIHEVGLDFLLHHGWFPSTSIDPRTAATFQLLHHFRILSFESKASAYEFYHSLVCLTDNTGLTKPKWRHLKMLKQFGHGHETSGVEGTSQGECVIICPACPQPGINLPNGWEHATKDKWWLYATFVTIDANFHLRRHNVSTDDADPSLSKGWSYFVEEADYKSYLAEHLGEAQEKSTCSSHNAVNMADTKKVKSMCRELIMLYRYINMNYLFFSTLRNNSLKILNWHKHIWSCMVSLPQSHHLDYVSKIIHFFILKFHLPAHVTKCQSIFLFNFTRFIGWTDGEAPERVALSMKNMGPGCRLGASLLNKMKDALVERAEHQATFDKFDAVISIEHHATWLSEMEVWEQNPNDTTIPNPLETKAIAITQAGAWLRLAELEAHKLEHGSLVESMGVHITDTQWGSIVRMQNSLHCKIETWGRVQVLYMPAVLQGGCDDQHNAEDIILWLPSQMKNKPCDQHLQNNEWELHYAQAHDVLEELRQCLRIHCSLLTFKREWIHGQGANMQAQNALTHIHAWRTACVKHYRSAWTALKFLALLLKKMDWKGQLQELADEHIKPLVDLFGVGEGRHQVSWIWMMEGINCNGRDCDDDGVHIEWCKSRARALRWTEQVELLTEEMERVIQFFHWDTQHWEERRGQIAGENPAHTEGLRAYAAQQADICCRLAGHFHALWLSLPDLTMPVMDTDDFCDDHA
ncbi:hypothetical protein BDR06DRAFT_983690 [Suillus hirtellus]|nr:hypothetical protein BDR06DRAFT_983690 [Suillus hirtellus]